MSMGLMGETIDQGVMYQLQIQAAIKLKVRKNKWQIKHLSQDRKIKRKFMAHFIDSALPRAGESRAYVGWVRSGRV